MNLHLFYCGGRLANGLGHIRRALVLGRSSADPWRCLQSWLLERNETPAARASDGCRSNNKHCHRRHSSSCHGWLTDLVSEWIDQLPSLLIVRAWEIGANSEVCALRWVHFEEWWRRSWTTNRTGDERCISLVDGIVLKLHWSSLTSPLIKNRTLQSSTYWL